MPSPQVQQWLDDGTRLREDLLAQMEKLEAQRQELERQVGQKRVELSLLGHILDRADESPVEDAAPAGSDDPFNPNFNAKAASAHKAPPRDVWHAGMS